MPGLHKSELARADLVDHYIYLYEEAGEAVANRFLGSVEKSFAQVGRWWVRQLPCFLHAGTFQHRYRACTARFAGLVGPAWWSNGRSRSLTLSGLALGEWRSGKSLLLTRDRIHQGRLAARPARASPKTALLGTGRVLTATAARSGTESEATKTPADTM